jgi:tRNA (adenine37-N6)-methyltransferase
MKVNNPATPNPITITPIGVVHNSINEVQDDIFGGVISRIELDPERFTSDSLLGLDSFSHVEIIFVLHQVADSAIHTGARHPRGNPAWPKAGIFAQRAKYRPNRIAVTVCRLLKVHSLTVEVESLDAINGTPILDIKPYMSEFGPRGPVYQPDWATQLMSRYWNQPK